MIRLLVVGQIRLYSEGLGEVLSRSGEFDVVGTASSSLEAVEIARECAPAVVLVDQAMPDSLATAAALAQLNPPVQTVALAVPAGEREIMACATAGFSAWVVREASLEELVKAIRCAVAGELACSPYIAGSLLRQVQALSAAGPPSPGREGLTPRQMEILTLVDRGLCNKEIARALGIELSTVKNHVHDILDRLHVHQRARAAAMVRPFLRQPAGQVPTWQGEPRPGLVPGIPPSRP